MGEVEREEKETVLFFAVAVFFSICVSAAYACGTSEEHTFAWHSLDLRVFSVCVCFGQYEAGSPLSEFTL